METPVAKENILIAEDSPVQAETLRRLLYENGYKVIQANNGAEALAMAKKEGPNLIISDILMPVMDGYELCRRIKDDPELKAIPVILLTQLNEVEEVIKGLESGAENYFTKPYNKQYLISKVESHLRNHEQFRNQPEKHCVEFEYNGMHYEIRSSRAQTLSFLFSTYENAVRQNKELDKAHNQLKELNGELERKVIERTSALNDEIDKRKMDEKKLLEQLDELRRFQTATVGRELRMHEINEENKKLKEMIDELRS